MSAELLEELLAVVGVEGLVTGKDALASHATDWSGWGAAEPLAVVRPASTEQVSAVLRICHAHDQPVVPQGGLSGLAGGAVPAGGALALSLKRLSGVEEIDPLSATMSVKAGTILSEAQDAALEAGFLLAMDLGGRGTAQVGGNVSTNAGGNRVIRYGMTREQVLGLEAVLADGTIIDARSKLLKNNAGFDLKHLFIGSEGTLGVVTRVVFRLHPLPKSQCVALLAVPRFDDIHTLLRQAASALGARLTAFEAMWDDFLRVAYRASPALRQPFRKRWPHQVLIEVRGEDEERDRGDLERYLGEALEAGLAADAVLAQSGREVAELWAIRDSSGEIGRHLGSFINLDVSIEASRMGAFVEQCRDLFATLWPEGQAVFFGHVGDGNIHVLFGHPAFSASRKKEAEAAIYGLVREAGGSIAAEHGIGRMKGAYLGHTRSAAEIALMKTLKAALDPKGILNPGAVLSA